MKESENNFVAINGGKKENPNDDGNDKKKATLTIDGQTIELDSFILSGENKEGQRVLLTWNASLDQLCAYNSVLDIAIQDKIRETLSD